MVMVILNLRLRANEWNKPKHLNVLQFLAMRCILLYHYITITITFFLSTRPHWKDSAQKKSCFRPYFFMTVSKFVHLPWWHHSLRAQKIPQIFLPPLQLSCSNCYAVWVLGVPWSILIDIFQKSLIRSSANISSTFVIRNQAMVEQILLSIWPSPNSCNAFFRIHTKLTVVCLDFYVFSIVFRYKSTLSHFFIFLPSPNFPQNLPSPTLCFLAVHQTKQCKNTGFFMNLHVFCLPCILIFSLVFIRKHKGLFVFLCFFETWFFNVFT